MQLIAEQPTKKPMIDFSTLGKNPNFANLLASAMSALMKGLRAPDAPATAAASK
ncbi:MAG: hypothetical protein ACRELF_21335 [Gemmataceae bacterium]